MATLPGVPVPFGPGAIARFAQALERMERSLSSRPTELRTTMNLLRDAGHPEAGQVLYRLDGACLLQREHELVRRFLNACQCVECARVATHLDPNLEPPRYYCAGHADSVCRPLPWANELAEIEALHREERGERER